MHHLAVMKKSWNFLEEIVSKEKTIESRWYKTKRNPWNKIYKKDSIYFKNSGECLTVKAEVESVLQFQDITPQQVKEILKKYGHNIGIKRNEIVKFTANLKDKKYCILIFLKNPTNIEPFEINKIGHGAMTAWICVENILELKK